MIFKTIELFNIRQFDCKRFEFKNGFNLIAMEHLQGESTLIQSMRSALSTAPNDSLGLLNDGTSESKIVMKFEIDSKSYTAVKQWVGGILTQHNIVSDETDTRFDLCDPVQCFQWAHLFLRVYDKQPSTDIHGRTNDASEDKYRFFLSLVFPGLKIGNLPERAWQHEFFDVSFYDKIDQGVMRLMYTVSARLTELKTTRQAADAVQKHFLRFEHELEKIDAEITRGETAIMQLLRQAEGDESELKQAEKVNDFILTKKNEIEKIEFEMRSYGSLLKNNIAGEFSDEEIYEIDKKRRHYEQILKREESLNQKMIERGHFEKNLSGILTEISQLQITPGTADTASGIGRITAFKEEVMRIQAALNNYEGLETELESLKKEKFLYQSSFDKFHVINKIKQAISQNEQKKIRLTVEKLELDRDNLNSELEQMRSTVHEDHYQNLSNKVQQKRQQVLEYRRRLDELYVSRLEMLKSYETAKYELQDMSALEGGIRKQINHKKYLSMAAEVTRLMQNVLLHKRRDEFERYLNDLAGTLPGSYIELAAQLVSEEGSMHKLETEERFSHPEIEEFMQIFRLICLNYRTKIKMFFLDEHARRMLNESQNRRIDTLLGSLKVKQIIVFEPNTLDRRQ